MMYDVVRAVCVQPRTRSRRVRTRAGAYTLFGFVFRADGPG